MTWTISIKIFLFLGRARPWYGGMFRCLLVVLILSMLLPIFNSVFSNVTSSDAHCIDDFCKRYVCFPSKSSFYLLNRAMRFMVNDNGYSLNVHSLVCLFPIDLSEKTSFQIGQLSPRFKNSKCITFCCVANSNESFIFHTLFCFE